MVSTSSLIFFFIEIANYLREMRLKCKKKIIKINVGKILYCMWQLGTVSDNNGFPLSDLKSRPQL